MTPSLIQFAALNAFYPSGNLLLPLPLPGRAGENFPVTVKYNQPLFAHLLESMPNQTLAEQHAVQGWAMTGTQRIGRSQLIEVLRLVRACSNLISAESASLREAAMGLVSDSIALAIVEGRFPPGVSAPSVRVVGSNVAGLEFETSEADRFVVPLRLSSRGAIAGAGLSVLHYFPEMLASRRSFAIAEPDPFAAAVKAAPFQRRLSPKVASNTNGLPRRISATWTRCPGLKAESA